MFVTFFCDHASQILFLFFRAGSTKLKETVNVKEKVIVNIKTA